MKRLIALLVLVPVSLNAQSRTTLTGYLASDGGIEGHPLLVGATLAKEAGIVGARLSLGFDVTAPPPQPEDGSPRSASGIWSTDADGLLFLGNPRNGGLTPYAVGGIGMRGLQAESRLGIAVNYSYGGGFRAPLVAGLSLEGEARYRHALAEMSAPDVPVAGSGLELRVGMSLGLGRGGGRAPGLAPTPVRGPVANPTTSAARVRVASATLSSAERYIGIPYRWGGNTPQEGFDCSGFIRYVFAQNGITVPRVSRDQARYGSPVSTRISDLQPGDILAFATSGREVDHTAIYAGNGRIIHSSSSGGGVRYDNLYTERGQWYVRHLVAARRVIGGGGYAAR
jgi:cell wall-associated NlpC family hydrolase